MTIEDAIRVLILCDKKPNCKYTEEMIKTAQEVAAAIVIGQKPITKLDRSLWEGCDWCNQRYCDNCFWQIKMKDSSKCEHCIDKSE